MLNRRLNRHVVTNYIALTGADLIRAVASLHAADTTAVHAGNEGYSARVSLMIAGRVVNADVLIGGIRRFGWDDPLWRLELVGTVSEKDLARAGERLLEALSRLPVREGLVQELLVPA